MDNIELIDEDGVPLNFEDFLKRTYTDAFLVLHKGMISAEVYLPQERKVHTENVYDMRPETLHHVWSVGKSIAVGVAFNLLREGVIARDQKVRHILKNMEPTGYSDATVDHLLKMLAGVETRTNTSDEYAAHCRAAGMARKEPGDPKDSGEIAFVLRQKQDRDHGEIFKYSDKGSRLLSYLMERATNTRIADLIEHYIWSRIGAEQDALISCDELGSAQTWGGMAVSLRDLGRWGLVHLNGGKLSGEQIIPEEYVKNVSGYIDTSRMSDDTFIAKKDMLPGTAYCDQFWVPGGGEGAYSGIGAHGQYCYIHPKYETVIAKFSTQPASLEIWKMEQLNFHRISKALFEKSL